jgi:hypothetical protein
MNRMKKIISLFKRDYKGDRLVYNEIVPGAEWVIDGEGMATIKFDGTCCMVRKGRLFKRYDRKLTKKNFKRLKKDPSFIPTINHCKIAPLEWEAAELEPNPHTGHFPGWVPVSPDASNDQWHREAWERVGFLLLDGTFELVGPKVQGNPYGLSCHELWRHGTLFESIHSFEEPLRKFNQLKTWFQLNPQFEGIVWHHPDGRMVKIKRRDFGLEWPTNQSSEGLDFA